LTTAWLLLGVAMVLIVGNAIFVAAETEPPRLEALIPRKGGVMSAPQKYPPEVRDRAIRLVDDLLADDQLQLSVTGETPLRG
jgi:hypothetical protein